MVDAAGQHWPDGWVKCEGFVRVRGAAGDIEVRGTFPFARPVTSIGEADIRRG
ncbi:hypothetical protein [Nocardioides sp.]|uniref:hypothetical protein n=1 Tax=Nocardioides sp. TaxID=35761 RepID=UPI0039E70847